MSAIAPVIVPQCPHCNVALTSDWVRTGLIVCPYCGRPFNAALFQPPQRPTRRVESVEAFPEGANSCANHVRNAAVTSCQRCGLFICSLCDMNLGEGSYCPSCFDRVRAEGALRGAAVRHYDYGAMARLAVVAGALLAAAFLSIPLGALAIYYASKGAKQRRVDGESTMGMTIITVLGILEVIGGIAYIGFIVWAMVSAGTR